MRARGPLRLKLLVLSELYLLLLIDGIVEVRGVVLDAVPLELAAAPSCLLQEGRVAADGEELLHLIIQKLVVLAAAATCVDIVTAAVAATRAHAIDE